MKNLDQYRVEIDEIDEELIKLISKRMEISVEIGKFKKENGISVYDPKREAELKEKNLAKVPQQYQSAYSDIFDAILKASKDIQL